MKRFPLRRFWAIACLFALPACQTAHRNESLLSGTGNAAVTDLESRLQIALVKYDRAKCGNEGAFISRCTATRINANTVLTAAHCVVKGGEIAEVFKVEDFKKLNEVMPARNTDCVETEEFSKALLSIGAERPSKVFVVKEVKPTIDLALLEFSNLSAAVIPFAERKPTPGTQVTKIGFGTVDCREESPEGSYRFEQGGALYGIAKTTSVVLDEATAKNYDQKIASDPKRKFRTQVLSVSGEHGDYTCVGDSGAGALVATNAVWSLAGVHTGGVGMSNPSSGLKGRHKLETSISIHSNEFCDFLVSVGRSDLKQLFPENAEVCRY